MGRQHQGMDRPGICQVPEGSGGQGKMEEIGCEIICGAPNDCRGQGIDDDDAGAASFLKKCFFS